MNWKPLVASLGVIVVALLVLWAVLPGKTPDNRANAPSNTAENTDPTGTGSDGTRWVRVELEPLPELDPADLWPGDGMRVASPHFWIVWSTGEHTRCRLLLRGRGGSWYEAGHSLANIHYLPADLTQFDDELYFCVEWNENGRAYRSRERHVSFGAGACFEQRRYEFRVPQQQAPEFRMRLQGRSLNELAAEPFLTTLFPEVVVPAAYALPAEDTAVLRLRDGNDVPQDGCMGFLEVYDNVSLTYDRVLVQLRR